MSGTVEPGTEGEIRLANGNSTAGRVEIYLNGEWGTVCDDAWGIEDARVVCRQLGFSDAISAPGSAFFGEGEGLTQMDDVGCSGNEETLTSCSFTDSTNENCGHSEDAGVVCLDGMYANFMISHYFYSLFNKANLKSMCKCPVLLIQSYKSNSTGAQQLYRSMSKLSKAI